jgi:hypothetical protein
MSYIRTLHGFALLLPALGVALSSCGGATNEPGDSPGKVVSGAECTPEGRESPADDGCNTCACTEGAWSCTKKACLPLGTGGVTGAGGKPTTGGVTGAGGKPTTGGVTGAGGSTPACKQPPPDDGCNQCTCAGGQWACTDKACPPPLCQDGESKFDGCNTCKCSGGQWACTRIACPPADVDGGGAEKGCGGWLGNTCTASEYCAYLPGAHCGGGDASATCKPRPMACDAMYSPVCGCDGNPYGNACEAAAKGTGVLNNGPCL